MTPTPETPAPAAREIGREADFGLMKKPEILPPKAEEREPFGWYVYDIGSGTGTFVQREPAHRPGVQHVTPLFAATTQGSEPPKANVNDRDTQAVINTLHALAFEGIKVESASFTLNARRVVGAIREGSEPDALREAMRAGANAIEGVLDMIDNDDEYNEAKRHIDTLRTSASGEPPIAVRRVLADLGGAIDEVSRLYTLSLDTLHEHSPEEPR